jgi:murein DD-endopeptidase
MPGPRVNGDIPHFRRHMRVKIMPLMVALRNVTVKMRHVPLLLILAGCAASPPPPTKAAVPAREWDGAGGASSMRNRGEALADFALRLRGTPYRYGGATLDGLDCSGLVFYVHRTLGLSVPRTSSDQAELAPRIKPRKLRRGDLVFFKIGSRRVNHVGIYVGDHRFVHAPGAGKPVTTNSLDDQFYAERFFAAGRFWNQLPK